MSLLDSAAAIIFLLCWLVYEPFARSLKGGRGSINTDMRAVREAWLRQMMTREMRITDANLLGAQLSTASFFASANLLVIAAAAGLLFGGSAMLANIRGLLITDAAPAWLIEVKIALVVVALTKGLLDFVWAIRQLNYALALFGAAPEHTEPEHHESYVRAVIHVLNPAYNAFNSGMRDYYFSLAAAAWIISPWAMIAAALGACAVLLRRQVASDAAFGIREARRILETRREGKAR